MKIEGLKAPTWLQETSKIPSDIEVRLLSERFLYENSGTADRLEIAKRIFRMANGPQRPKYAVQFAELLGFNKLIGDHNGQKYFEIPSDSEKNILTILNDISVDENGGPYTMALNLAFSVASNGMPEKEAQIFLDVIANPNGSGLKDLKTSFQKRKNLPDNTLLPGWVITRYYPGYSKS